MCIRDSHITNLPANTINHSVVNQSVSCVTSHFQEKCHIITVHITLSLTSTDVYENISFKTPYLYPFPSVSVHFSITYRPTYKGRTKLTVTCGIFLWRIFVK